MMRLVVIPVLLTIASLACNSTPTEPSEHQGLRLEASISSPTVRLGDFEELTFRLRNVAAVPHAIEFTNFCGVMVYIETTAGIPVYPPSAMQVCADVVTWFKLPHGAEHVTTREIFGGARVLAIHTAFPLPAGRYRAYATVDIPAKGVRLRSSYVGFEVR